MSKNVGTKQQTTARCVFCNRPGVDHQHIWPKWIRKLIGKDHVARVESIMTGGTLEAPTYAHRKSQGGVHTKSARKVCPKCNRGWMRDIELAAEIPGTKLIKGEQIDLDKESQAKWAILAGQSALMIDLLGKSHNKFPKSDLEFFYTHKTVPPRWYVGIGYFYGPTSQGLRP
jgi:hypothetical protein